MFFLQEKIARGNMSMKLCNKLYLLIFISAFILLIQYQMYYNNNNGHYSNESVRQIEKIVIYNTTVSDNMFILCIKMLIK